LGVRLNPKPLKKEKLLLKPKRARSVKLYSIKKQACNGTARFEKVGTANCRCKEGKKPTEKRNQCNQTCIRSKPDWLTRLPVLRRYSTFLLISEGGTLSNIFCTWLTVPIMSPHKYRDPEITPQIALQKIENNFTNQLLPSVPMNPKP